jgi:hypothetical protein
LNQPLSTGVRLRALVTAAIVPPLLSLVSLQRLAGYLGHSGWLARSAGFDDGDLAAWVDQLLYRWPGPWHRTCLNRSAVLYHLLRAAGRGVELRIGVRRDQQGQLAAHAWLTRGTVPYLETEPGAPGQHTVIAVFPNTSAPA